MSREKGPGGTATMESPALNEQSTRILSWKELKLLAGEHQFVGNCVSVVGSGSAATPAGGGSHRPASLAVERPFK
jgi:hypothetical protein